MVQVQGPLARELREMIDGKRDFPATAARRHHFVPAFVLAQFAMPRGDRRGFLFQLDTASGKPQKTTPNDTAFEKDLYVRETEDGRDLVLESFFSVVEKHASAAFMRLMDNPLAISDDDRQTIAYFLAFQYTRTPVAIDHTSAWSQAMMELVFGVHIANPIAFREIYREAIGEATDEEIEVVRRDITARLERGEIVIRNPKAQAFKLMLGTADHTATVIANLQWTVLQADEDEFVTSDRPLALHDPTPKFPWSGHAWVSSPNAETTFPVSPRLCLHFSPGSPSVSTAAVGSSDVRNINLRTYGWAPRYIYGRTQAVVTEVRRHAKRYPTLVVRPRKSLPVIVEEADPDDPTVGVEHVKRGWPRGVWYDDPSGEPRFMAYTLIDPGDRTTIQAAIEGGNVSRRVIERAVREGRADPTRLALDAKGEG